MKRAAPLAMILSCLIITACQTGPGGPSSAALGGQGTNWSAIVPATIRAEAAPTELDTIADAIEMAVTQRGGAISPVLWRNPETGLVGSVEARGAAPRAYTADCVLLTVIAGDLSDQVTTCRREQSSVWQPF